MNEIKNLVFEGGGVWGIAYLGVLEYLAQQHLLQHVQKVAGNSAGAITACIVSLNLPFPELKERINSLDYKKIPQKGMFGEISSIYRLLTKYGWYSTEYLYLWLQKQIASQFNEQKKKGPYTFADFYDTSLHKNERPFLDLSVIATDNTKSYPTIFSYEHTPNMEVALAVRISMSVPFFFESITERNINYSDGGLLLNYPIELFNTPQDLPHTLGFVLENDYEPGEIKCLHDFVESIFHSLLTSQRVAYLFDEAILKHTVKIPIQNISSLNFNITTNDDIYILLYETGYNAAKNYFLSKST